MKKPKHRCTCVVSYTVQKTPNIPIISTARSRITQPAPRFEQAPSRSAKYQPSTASSETSNSQPESTPSISSNSWSHARTYKSKSPIADAIDVLTNTDRPNTSA